MTQVAVSLRGIRWGLFDARHWPPRVVTKVPRVGGEFSSTTRLPSSLQELCDRKDVSRKCFTPQLQRREAMQTLGAFHPCPLRMDQMILACGPTRQVGRRLTTSNTVRPYSVASTDSSSINPYCRLKIRKPFLSNRPVTLRNRSQSTSFLSKVIS